MEKDEPKKSKISAQERTAQWQASRLPYIRGLPNPSATQRHLLLLIDKPDRTPEDTRKMGTLWRAERSDAKNAEIQAKARQVVRSDHDAAQKARNHRLIQLGGLIDLAGVGSWDKGTLLGALMGLAQVTDAERLARWKSTGDEKLASKKPTPPQKPTEPQDIRVVGNG